MSRVLEIAASTRVLRERRLRALEESPAGAVLGRDFVTFRGFAERCAAETESPVRALLGGPELVELVALCARGNGVLGEWLAERPGLAAALAATLRDLRDAGVAPDDLPRSHRDLSATHSAFERALARLEKEGLFDRVGLFRLAQKGVSPYLGRAGFERIEVHGATELVGSVGDLLAKADESLNLQFFQPDFASPYVETLDQEWPWSFRPESTEVIDQPALARDGEIPAGVVAVRRARSPRAELEGVARDVLSLLERGVAPSQIQIVARSLDPYAPWLESVLGGYGIPFTSSLRVPGIAAPARAVWLDLARAVTRDLERSAVVRLAHALEPSVGARLAPLVGALAERVGRERAVVRGVRDWTRALEDDGKSSPEQGALERLVARLASAAGELAQARDFAAAAGALASLGSELFGEASRAGVNDALESLVRLDHVRAAAGAGESPGPEQVERAFDAALREASATPFVEDDGGVRVLDAVQARAVPCSHLYLIGMVHGAWPRTLADDPFLGDSVRSALRARLRRPVPLRSAVAEEDRFLLGLLLSQARERVVLSWSDSDSSGRAQSPSAFLRTLPFVAPGTNVLSPEPEPWEGAAPTFARRAEALCAAAGDLEELEKVARGMPAGTSESLRAGLELVRHVDALRAESLPYDGEVDGALAPPAELSPSHVELLGQCPLRGFFARMLRAKPLEPRSPDELEPNEAGDFVHDALEKIYPRLRESGVLDPGTPLEVALARARELVPEALDEIQSRQRTRVRERHPTAWRAFRNTIGDALLDFLERDLESLLQHGVTGLDTEEPIRAQLRAGSESLVIEGTIDRIARLANGEIRVGDYKTGLQFDRPLNHLEIKRGTALQIPLYTLAVAEHEPAQRVRGETLSVPLRPERDRDRLRDEERWVSASDLASWSSTGLAQIAALIRVGFFPIANRPADKACRKCPYTVACRIQHPQSAARIASHESSRGYFALQGRK